MTSSVVTLSVVSTTIFKPHAALLIYVEISLKKFTVKTQEYWKTLNVTLNCVLLEVSNKFFEILQDIL